MPTRLASVALLMAAPLLVGPCPGGSPPDKVPAAGAGAKPWQVGTPIVTYWAGPPLTDAVARQMAEGGFNLVWCGEKELDTARRHGLRAQLTSELLNPAVLDDPGRRKQLDGLIDRVRDHPALYSYFLTDEPSAGDFARWGRLVAYLRERDPAHLGYINLFPTYATNQQLGTTGEKVPAYREHLRQYLDVVKPALISYDHYQFAVGGDKEDYFLNLAIIREAARKAGLPFLNIVQACTWDPAMRVPTGEELRFLASTTLAYGAQGLAYYVYCTAGHTGGMALPDGKPTPLYEAARPINREFAAAARQLQPLVSLGVYHAGMAPPGSEPIPADAAFRLDPALPAVEYRPPERVRGALISTFGRDAKATHAVVVNLDYKAPLSTSVVGSGPLEVFDAATGTWSAAGGPRAAVVLPPGGMRLVRTAR